MTDNNIEDIYFNWLYDKICCTKAYKVISYYNVLRLLFNKPFSFTIDMDSNRASDGIGLRYAFDMANDPDNLIATNMIQSTCSVLEMMYALSIKIEHEIMDDPRYGDRTNQWFWEMMKNLGLSMMTDDNYDEEIANEIINIFIYREYDYDGKGNIFYVRNSDVDLRNLELWVQAECYLDRMI